MSAWKALVVVALLGCATPRVTSPAEQYAHALEEGQLDAAYALTTPAFQAQVSASQFRARFSEAAARSARATAVRTGLAELAQAAPELYGRDATEAPEEVIFRFATAIRASRFDEARTFLSVALRQRYTAETLSHDFAAEPSAAARLERAVLAAEGIPVKDGHTVRFALPEGGVVVVALESDGWKLEALE